VNTSSQFVITVKYVTLGAFAALGALVALGMAGCAHEAKPPAVSSVTVTNPSGEVIASTGEPVGITTTTSATVPGAAMGDPTLAPVTADSPSWTPVPNRLIDDAPTIQPRTQAVPVMSRWPGRYPDAARLLSEWTHDHETTARRLAEWADKNPDQMQTLVDWSITNVSESLGAFFFNRAAWTDFQRIADTDREGVEDFVLWIRRAPTAAKELSAHPSGLAFATTHEAQLAHENSASVAGAR
jgi:hypothetical protein